MPFLRELHVYQDLAARSAAMNMAVDETLFENARAPSLRLYGWRRPSLSFGYFGLYAEVAPESARREIVRRWTGGGIVFHGTDLTYALILPRRGGGVQLSPRVVYTQVHEAVRLALSPHLEAKLASSDAPKISAACFANSVVADVLVGERKIAGAAQRRTRAGLLQQGSIQCEPLPPDFVAAFAGALCKDFVVCSLGEELLECARALATQKYETVAWLQQR